MADESSCIGHEECPKCGSRDNLARYDDGHGYCFGCKHYESPTGEATEALQKSPSTLVEGEPSAIPSRRLTEESCRKLRYLVGRAKHPKTGVMEPVQIATYCDASGRPVAQKLRWKDKAFKFIGEPKKATLFGQQLWRDGGKKVVITEGEIDAVTVSQAQGNKWPVVSIPTGASGAKKSLASQLEWLNKFDEVILMFDDDEPGRAAVEECVGLFPPGKVKSAVIDGFKDASEAMVAGQAGRIIDAIFGAKEYRPDGIVDVAAVAERAVVPVEFSGLSWPWASLDKLTYGRRRGEVYGWAGGTGMGKTTLFKQVQAHLVTTQSSPIGVIALEEPPHHSLKTLAGVIDGVRYHVPGVEYGPEKLRSTINGLQGKVYLYDHFGAATFETIIEKMRYMHHAFGVRDFFLDHLTALAATMGDDERKAIDVMMAELSGLMIELDSTLDYISHLTTPEGKSHEEGGRVQERHLRGSRSIAYWSHFIFALEGNKQEAGEPRRLRVLKDRFTGDSTGLVIGLQYDRETGRMYEVPLEDGPFRDESSGF